MKRTLCSLMLVLALLTGCSTAAAPKASAKTQPSPVPAPVTLAATEENKLVIVLTDCNNSITIRESDGAAVAFSGAADSYQYTVSGPVDGVTTVRITQTKDVDFNGATLTVPLDFYSAIAVQGKNYASSLRPQKANYEITGEDCAASAVISSAYSGSFFMDMKDSSISVTLNAPKNLALTLDAKNCAISTPKEWNYKQDKVFSMSRGTDGAALNFRLRDCAVSFEETTTDLISRYEDQPTNMSMSMNSNLEMVLGDSLGSGSYGYGNRDMEQWRASAKANTVADISTIPSIGITELQINANLCGLVLEPSKSNSFELSLQGVEDIKIIQVTTKTKNGVLTVTAEGIEKDGLYINASPDYRVNCVRLLVPEGVLQTLSVDCGTGIIATDGLALPSVTGGALRGMVALTANNIASPVTMSSRSGCLRVTADTVSAPITLDTNNGSVEVFVGTATGKLSLTATNGSVESTVGEVKDASFTAKNGSVDVSLGLITGNTSCTVTNGAIEVELTKKPADLSFRLDGDWKENQWDDWKDAWYDKEPRPTGLPDGWYDGMVLGSGRPTLTLSASSNGDLSLTLPTK